MKSQKLKQLQSELLKPLFGISSGEVSFVLFKNVRFKTFQ